MTGIALPFFSPHKMTMRFSPDAPIGVFDSGVGGLSVLQHIRQTLPHESLIYFADSGFAPYGEKPESVIIERCYAITDFLLQHQIKALVVACNTATAAAIQLLRQRHPELIIVGIEPGLKPAAALSKSGVIGVLATLGTLHSQKFQDLRDHLTQTTDVKVEQQACVGLASQIEKGELRSAATFALVQKYVAPLLNAGADAIVLGCTHYPFVIPLINDVIAQTTEPGKQIHIIDTGFAVAQQLQRRLIKSNLLSPSNEAGSVSAWTTGSQSSLTTAFTQLLNMPATTIHTLTPQHQAADK